MDSHDPERDLGRHLFTFAVISDSHVNEGEDESASPYPSNRLANGRLRYVVARVNRQRPAFTVHLGDLIDRDWASFERIDAVEVGSA